MALRTEVTAHIRGYLTGTADHGTPKADLDLLVATVMLSGTSAGEADRIYSDRRSLAASGTEDIDLSGSLADVIGGTDVFAKVKAVLVRAPASNTNNVIVGAGTNPWIGPFGAGTHSVAVPPGGAILLLAPVNGWAVTAATADILKITNSSSGSGVDYDIIIVGTSA